MTVITATTTAVESAPAASGMMMHLHHQHHHHIRLTASHEHDQTQKTPHHYHHRYHHLQKLTFTPSSSTTPPPSPSPKTQPPPPLLPDPRPTSIPPINDPRAMRDYALSQHSHHGAPMLLEKAGEMGCIQAFVDLGHLYETGYIQGHHQSSTPLMKVDKQKALDFFAKAENHPTALYHRSRLLSTTHPQFSHTLLVRSASHGYPAACFEYGGCGGGVMWREFARDRCDWMTEDEGWMEEHRRETLKDFLGTWKEVLEGVLAGDVDKRVEMGRLFKWMGRGDMMFEELAITLFYSVAASKDATAAYELGRLFQYGHLHASGPHHNEPNMKAACMWYHLSATRGTTTPSLLSLLSLAELAEHNNDKRHRHLVPWVRWEGDERM
ncbi:hypothetical protein BC829DRAFT_150548 [Chytridium lagenaria]|nr:hypothetical protein BC829DRAFT_150548 [Chytridium lagenaria]